MSSAKSVLPPSQVGRRAHARRRINGLAYVDFGPDNGAILVDLGEGGLGFQSVQPVSLNQALLFKFKLPGENNAVDGYAEVAWLNDSKKGGGLRFVELNADASVQIREWTTVVWAPETGAGQAGKGAGSDAAQANAAENASAHSMQSTAREPIPGVGLPAEVSEVFAESLAPGERAQVASLSPNADEALPTDEAAAEQVPAGQAALPEELTIPEFVIEVTAASVSAERLDRQIEWAAPAAPPISAASAAESGAAESTRLHEPEQNEDDAAEFAAGLVSDRAHLRFEESDRLHSNPESGAVGRPLANDFTHRGSDVQRTPAGPKTTAGPERTKATAAAPTKAARVPEPDAGNFAPVQKPQRRPAPSKPESAVSAYRQDSIIRESFVRQPQKPAPARTEWNYPLTSQGEELKPQATLGSQALRIGIGAAAGVCLMLALVFSVSSLRARVQATANAKSGGSNLAPAFQVEVADLNNRRWILKSGGDASSPFNDTPSRRETQAAAAAARSESAKSSRSDDSDDSSNTVSTPKPKTPRPSELLLSRPRQTPVAGTSAQLLAPSIFDGITPPIGSVSDRLASGGPDAPGIVQPESQSGVQTSALQSAVLEQRVAPIYPSNALQSRLEGEVLVNATIGRDGVPKDLKVIRGNEFLAPAALTAIRQWHYRPATLGGQPIETQIVITINFALK